MKWVLFTFCLLTFTGCQRLGTLPDQVSLPIKEEVPEDVLIGKLTKDEGKFYIQGPEDVLEIMPGTTSLTEYVDKNVRVSGHIDQKTFSLTSIIAVND